MSDKNIDWLRRLQLLEKALKENRVNDSACVALDGKISGYELDFSEHDKVFEDKIASLEKRMAYMKGKNNYLRTRCMEDAIDAFERGSYGALTIVGRRVDLEVENEKLKQRITELEEKNKNLVDMINKLQLEKAHIDCDLYDANKRITELESKESVRPMKIEFHADNGEMLTPLEIANSLINQDLFKVDELRELAEHLQVYCRHHNDREPETISF